MKKLLPVFLVIGVFAVLLGAATWIAWDQIKKRMPDETPETRAQRDEAIEKAYINPDGSAAEVEVDEKTREEVNEFFTDLGAAFASGESKRIGKHFSAETMIRSSEQRELVDFGSGNQRTAMVRGFEMGLQQGFSNWAEMIGWDDYKIARVSSPGDGKLVVYGKFWDGNFGVYSKLRWWLIRQDGVWKAYDFEDFDTGIRMTAFLGIAMAAGQGKHNWMPKLMTAMQTVQTLYQDLETGYADTTEMEAEFRDLMTHDLPAEIESVSRIMLGTALLMQERFEEALEELQPVKGQSDSPMLFYQRGACLAGLERYDEALVSFEEYASILGWDSDLYEMTADIYLTTDDREKAVEHSLLGLEDNPKSIGCFATLAVSLPDDRKDELKEHAVRTDDAEAAWELAIDYSIEQEERKTAEAVFAMLKETQPKSELIEYYQDNEDLGSGIDVTEWSFDDWLNDPEVRKMIEEKYNRIQSFSESVGELSGDQIEVAIEQLLPDEVTPVAERLLTAQGEKAIPALIEALRDPRFLKPYAPEGSEEFEEMYIPFPAGKVIDLLGSDPRPEMVIPLEPLMDQTSPKIRRDAANLAARIGTKECIGIVIRGLKDEDGGVRNLTRYGISRAVNEDESSPEFRDTIFSVLKEQIAGAPANREPDPSVWTLLTIDEERAVEFLKSPDLLRPEHPALHLIIEGLNGREIQVEPARLVRILEHYHPIADQERAGRAFGAALQNLSVQGHDAAEPWARKVLEHPSKTVRESAVYALCEIEGMWEIDWIEVQNQSESERVLQILDDLDYVSWIDEDMSEGGFEYFLGELYDTEPGVFLDALKRVGGKQSADILKRAVALFGPAGLPGDEEERWEKLEQMLEKDPDTFEALDEEWFEDKDRLEVIRNLYMLNHKEELFAEAKKLGLPEKEEPEN